MVKRPRRRRDYLKYLGEFRSPPCSFLQIPSVVTVVMPLTRSVSADPTDGGQGK